MQEGSKPKEGESALFRVYRQYCSGPFTPHTESAATGLYVATLLTEGYAPVAVCWEWEGLNSSSCKKKAKSRGIPRELDVMRSSTFTESAGQLESSR